jgi:pimeloyl-ACP methyl ester carboxylesterase
VVSSFTVIRGGIRATSAVSPRLAGRLATQAFSLTQPRMPVREADAVTHFAARRGMLRVGSEDVTTYRWGAGDRTVLLLHGWRGRASQFAPLVRELVSEGFHVVSFDAPAHGDSTGRRTDIRDWIDATEQLQRAHGRFSAIIGHSFGALAGLTAARNGVTTGAVAAISGAASPDAFLGQFSAALDLDAPTRAAFGRSFRARVGEDQASVFARYDAVADPLPAAVDLLVVHDKGDRQMPPLDSQRLHAAHGARSRLLLTEGLGHNRVLSADPVLDAVVALTTGGLPAIDALRGDERQPVAA